ncbi:MAG: hypothetical protein LBJ31_11815 [Treponema sp.]|jgi:hypothetical protein|nr:hypothetical protein [Treponema sp.]
MRIADTGRFLDGNALLLYNAVGPAALGETTGKKRTITNRPRRPGSNGRSNYPGQMDRYNRAGRRNKVPGKKVLTKHMNTEKRVFILFVLLNPVAVLMYVIIFGIPIYALISASYLSDNYSEITDKLLDEMLGYEEIDDAKIVYDNGLFKLDLQIALLLKNGETILYQRKIKDINEYRS